MKYLVFILLIVFAFSCKKVEDRTCFKFTGDEIEKTISLDVFHKLKLGAYLEYVLVEDTACFVVLKGGENVVNLVSTEVTSGDLLQIKNTNRCRFLRSSKKHIHVEIHYVNLKEIFYEGSELLKNEGVLTSENLTVILNEGSGSVNLHVKCGKLNVAAEPSWADYVISGETTEARLSIKGNAYGDTRGLKVDSVMTVISRSSVDLEVNAGGTKRFKCEIWGSGNVYYSGIPDLIEWNDYGTGKLLPRN